MFLLVLDKKLTSEVKTISVCTNRENQTYINGNPKNNIWMQNESTKNAILDVSRTLTCYK